MFARQLVAAALLLPLCAGSPDDAVVMIQSSAQLEAGQESQWLGQKKSTPHPLNIELGRKITQQEFNRWKEEHQNDIDEGKQIPVVMNRFEERKFQDEHKRMPNLQKMMIQYGKDNLNMSDPEIKAQVHEQQLLETNVKHYLRNNIDVWGEKAKKRRFEHEVMDAKNVLDKISREEMRKNLENWNKKPEEENKNKVVARKSEILKQEEDAELAMYKKSKAIDKSVQEEKQNIGKHKRMQKEIGKAKHWAESHFVKAEIGGECPEGWSPVLDRHACVLAQKVLGGHEKTREIMEDPTMPGGCFYSFDRELVLFNDYPGKPSNRAERYCESVDAMSDKKIKKHYKKVVQAEMQKQDLMMRKIEADRKEELATENVADEDSWEHNPKAYAAKIAREGTDPLKEYRAMKLH